MFLSVETSPTPDTLGRARAARELLLPYTRTQHVYLPYELYNIYDALHECNMHMCIWYAERSTLWDQAQHMFARVLSLFQRFLPGKIIVLLVPNNPTKHVPHFVAKVSAMPPEGCILRHPLWQAVRFGSVVGFLLICCPWHWRHCDPIGLWTGLNIRKAMSGRMQLRYRFDYGSDANAFRSQQPIPHTGTWFQFSTWYVHSYSVGIRVYQNCNPCRLMAPQRIPLGSSEIMEIRYQRLPP